MKADKVVEEIYEIVRVLGEQDISELSGDTLSRLAVKLAAYKALLGEYVGTARRVEDDAEANYQLARAKAYKTLREEGKGSTDSDELKRIGANMAFLEWNEAKENRNRITQLSIDCHDLIDGIKSRLIHLQTERSESHVE